MFKFYDKIWHKNLIFWGVTLTYPFSCRFLDCIIFVKGVYCCYQVNAIISFSSRIYNFEVGVRRWRWRRRCKTLQSIVFLVQGPAKRICTPPGKYGVWPRKYLPPFNFEFSQNNKVAGIIWMWLLLDLFCWLLYYCTYKNLIYPKRLIN